MGEGEHRHRRGQSKERHIVPSKSSRSLEDPLTERKARRGGLGAKQGSSKSMDGGMTHRQLHNSTRSLEDNQSVEDNPISAKRRGRRGLGREQKPSSSMNARARNRSRSRDGLGRNRDRSVESSPKFGPSSNSLDVGSKHRSRHTKSGWNSRSTHSHSEIKKDASRSLHSGSNHRSRHTNSLEDGLDSRSNHSHSRHDELHARSTHSSASTSKGYRRSKSHDRERDDIETKRNERHARSKSRGRGAEEVGYKRSRSKSRDDAYKSKERRGTRATRPGAERSTSHRSLDDAKELRSRSRSAGYRGMTASTSVQKDRTLEKAKRHDDESIRDGLRMPHKMKIDESTEGFALHAEAVDEDMNAKMIQHQVQEALNKMTKTKTTTELDTTALEDSGSDRDDSEDPPRRCMTGPSMCVLALVLLVVGVVVGFAAFRATSPVKPVTLDVPTDAPTESKFTPLPTNLLPINQPPSKDDCEAIQKQLPVAGQTQLDVVSFDIQMEILVDDEGNYAGTMASIILAIEQDIIPGLTGCTRALQRRLKENAKSLRFGRSRQLEETRYPIANAEVSGKYNDGDESCSANNVTSANETRSYRTLTLTIDTFANVGADTSEIVTLIEYAVDSELLEEKLGLPGNTTIGLKEVLPVTSAPTTSSVPSITTMTPTKTTSPPIPPSANPTRAPVSGPTKRRANSITDREPFSWTVEVPNILSDANSIAHLADVTVANQSAATGRDPKSHNEFIERFKQQPYYCEISYPDRSSVNSSITLSYGDSIS